MQPDMHDAFVSPAARLEAPLWKATKRPSAEMDGRDGKKEKLLAWVPSEATLTRSVTPVRRSWTKTSLVPFVSPLTRLEAELVKATKRPSAEMDGVSEKPSPCEPSDATLTRSVLRVQPARGFPFEVQRSWTKTSSQPFVSPQ